MRLAVLTQLVQPRKGLAWEMLLGPGHNTGADLRPESISPGSTVSVPYHAVTGIWNGKTVTGKRSLTT